MTRYVAAALCLFVAERAFECCEHCRIPQSAAIARHHNIEHIVPLKHGGQTTKENLALSCPFCNEQKSTDVGSFDFETDGALTRFFNLRQDVWAEHFRLAGDGKIESLTVQARVMVKILQFNNAARIEERKELI